MVLDIKKFSGLDSLSSFLKGRLRGTSDLVKNTAALYLHGKTLIFATPAETVTFAASPAAAQVPLTLAQVKTQIEAQTTGVSVGFVQGAIELYMTTPGTLVLDKDGTANAYLGFSSVADSTVKPINPSGGAAPKFVSLVPEPGAGTYLLVTDV